MGLEWSDLDPRTWPGQVSSRLDKDFGPGTAAGEEERKKLLAEQAAKAGSFASHGERMFINSGGEGRANRQDLRNIANGSNSISAEQLRQGLQQNLAGQQSMAAGARGGNAAMAARTAAINSARMGSGMAGQQAVAGLAERQQAQQALAQSIASARGQDLQAALGSRENAMTGYGANNAGKQEASGTEKALAAGAALLPFLVSDKRLKKNIKDGDEAALDALKKLPAKIYEYKSEKHGKGRQLGFLAQDLEKVAPDAIVETAEGKVVHAGKLGGANTAMISALARRMSKLEKGSK